MEKSTKTTIFWAVMGIILAIIILFISLNEGQKDKEEILRKVEDNFFDTSYFTDGEWDTSIKRLTKEQMIDSKNEFYLQKEDNKNFLLNFSKPIEIGKTVTFTFIPLSDIINVIVSGNDADRSLYEIVIGDNDNKSLTVKKYFENGGHDFIGNQNGITRKEISSTGIRKGEEVNLYIKGYCISNKHALNISMNYVPNGVNNIGIKNLESQTYKLEIPCEDFLNISVGLIVSDPHADIKARFKEFKVEK